MSATAGDGDDRSTTGTRVDIDIDLGSVVVFVAIAALVAAVWSILTTAPNIVTPILVGVVLGLALSPVVGAVQRRWDTGRGTASLVVGGGLVLFLAAVVLVVAPPAVDQARDFGEELPATVESLYSWPVIGERLEEADAVGEVEQWIDDLPSSFDDQELADLGERLLGGAFSTVVALVAALGVLVDGPVLVQRIRSVVPPSRRERADEMGQIVYQSFGSYFAGSLFVAVLNGLVILSTGLVLGIPLAPLAGLWSMLTNFIPQIGGFLGGSFLVLLALTESPVTALVAGAVFLLYQQFENNVVQPAIVGSAVNLTPPATMLAALVGGAAAGVPGALVATPLLGAGKALYLVRRGRLPERREPALTRQLRRRLQRARQRVTGAAEAVADRLPDLGG